MVRSDYECDDGQGRSGDGDKSEASPVGVCLASRDRLDTVLRSGDEFVAVWLAIQGLGCQPHRPERRVGGC